MNDDEIYLTRIKIKALDQLLKRYKKSLKDAKIRVKGGD
jgi:hypothetical protein